MTMAEHANKVSATHFAQMSVSEIRSGLEAGHWSAQDIVEDSFDHINRTDAQIHAFLEQTKNIAGEKAAAIDAAIAAGRASELGTLAGVPLGVKDNMNLKGSFTTCASRMLENYRSPYTATCVKNMCDADALVLGKLNMDEFAFGSSTETSVFGNTFNPWDTARVPGGSSGGSAAAVAAGMATVALGSDTGGSIRQPASFCGVIGVKPTYGMVSRYGVVAFGSSLDQVGPFARSVEDAALALNALCGPDPFDCTSQALHIDFTENLHQGVEGMRIGVVPAFMEAKGITAEVKRKLEQAAEELSSAGAQLVDIELPHAEAAMSAYYVLGPCEAFSNLARFDSVRYGYCATGQKNLNDRYEMSRAKGFGSEAKRRILLGSYLLSSGVYDKYYYAAQKVRTLITQDYHKAFNNCDALLIPVSPRSAFKFGEISDPTEMYLSDMFTVSVNIAGNCATSMPVGLGEDTHLPIGVQIVGPHFKDEVMLRVAAVLEAAYGVAPVAPDFANMKGAERA